MENQFVCSVCNSNKDQCHMKEFMEKDGLHCYGHLKEFLNSRYQATTPVRWLKSHSKNNTVGEVGNSNPSS